MSKDLRQQHTFTILCDDEDNSTTTDTVMRNTLLSSQQQSSFHSPSTFSVSSSASTSSPSSLHGGNSTTLGASMNFVNSIVGAGIIGIPYAIQQCGFVLGMILLLLVAYFVKQSVMILIECGMKHEIYNLEDLCEYLLGSRGYYVSLLCMFLFGYGGQVAYLVIVGDTVPMVAEFISPSSDSLFHDRNSVMILFSVSIILPLCLLRDLSNLAWTSSLSIIADIVLIVVVFIAALSASEIQSEHFKEEDLNSINWSFFAGVGTMSFAFVCQHNSFLVFKSLQQPTLQEWDKVAKISIFSAYTLTLILGLIGFFAFYPFVQSDLLNNFPANYVTICIGRTLLAFTMVLTYPVECYVTRHCVVVFYYRWMRSSQAVVSDEEERGTTEEDHSQQQQQQQQRGDRFLLPSDSSHHHPHTIEGDDMDEDDNDNRQRGEDSGIEMTNIHTSSSSRHEGPTSPGGDDKDNNNEVMVKCDGQGNVNSREADEDEEAEVVVFNPYFTRHDETGYAAVNITSPMSTKTTNTSDGLSSSSSRSIGRHGDDIRSRSQKRECEEIPLFYHVMVTLILWGSTLVIALTSKTFGVVSGLTGAAAASTVGYTMPGLIYFRTYDNQFQATRRLVRSYLSQLGMFTQHHQQLRDSDEEEMSGDSNHGKHRILSLKDVWYAIYPFILPSCMVAFGICSMIIGIATILMS